MSQETKKVFVVGIYNWPARFEAKELRKNRDYPRHNWCDIDTVDQEYLKNVLKVFEKYKIDCISQRCGKGYHVWGDEVELDLWLKIWTEIRPFADPLWQPHTLRMSKKRETEVWERPIFYNYSNNNMKSWMKSVMSFLCKVLRNENSTNLWNAAHQAGLHKYFQVTVYPVEINI